jgi:glycyl-tRNA synthetase beta chain
MPDLLIELLSEEIPARMQARAADDLKRLVTDGLVAAGLTYADAAAFATPRRLTLSIDGLTPESRPVREERKGPATTAPEAALQGFLRSTGLTLDQLEQRPDKKGSAWFAVIEKPGRKAAEIVAETLEATIRDFPWPKSMRWGSGSLRWVRPLQSIICLLVTEAGAETVPLTIDGLTAGNTTRGHRFMAPAHFTVTSFDDYEAKLKRARVMLRPADRAAHIRADAESLAFAQGMELVPDDALLSEVAGLVEWPVTLMGPIEDRFLDLPPEVLQTSMREHQKFFSVKNPRTGRIERFITVANIETPDHGATILAGNAKVLAARLSDAKFFWENDLRTVRDVGLEGMGAGLAAVTFHNKLGSQADRVARIAALAREIAPLVGASPDLASEAARVAKSDLRSQMVGEFPELQGLMGRYYANAAGLPPEVAAACEDHYRPLGPSDAVPTAPVSIAVALADKIDTLTGFWAIDEKPTGSKDPFALRRAALGVIRLLLSNGVRESVLQTSVRAISEHRHIAVFALVPTGKSYTTADGGTAPQKLEKLVKSVEDFDRHEALGHEFFIQFGHHQEGAEAILIETVMSLIVAKAELIAADLLSFLHDRLKVFLRDEGIPHGVIDACLAMPGNDDLTLLVARARALAAFLKTDDGENLLQGFKRANNILTQAEQKDGVEYSFGADPKFAEAPEEHALFAALDAAERAIAPAMKAEDFPAAMSAMAALRAPIDAFFTAVQVNADNQIVRRNRLNLLSRIRTICLSVADLTRVEG